MTSSNNKLTQNKIFGISSMTGVARALMGFPLEQPLESIKTQW